MTRSKIRTSGAEGLTLSSTSLTVANGLTLTDGDIAFADGHGLNFASASGDASGMASELLDDYEEGTFTIGMGSGHSGSITLDNSFKTGVYTRVGSVVTFTAHIRTSAISSPGGTLDFTGLPFATPNDFKYRHTFGPCVYFNLTGMTDQDYPVAYLSNNSSTIIIALTNTNNIQGFPANRITASSELYITGAYQIS